jgi:tripartite ATP-independent transporter DctM subunit
MEWWVILLVFVGFLLLMLATGMPVAFSFLLINIVGAATVLGGEVGLRQMMLSIYSGLTSFTLAPVPLFVFMGEILFHSGMAIRTLDVLDKWMGRLPGRLSLLTVAGGTIFSNLSGSTMANTAMLGSLLVPSMQSRGYRKPMILGPILGTGGIAMIIPPSALAIVLGTLAHLSIGDLLLAGILPGLLMAAWAKSWRTSSSTSFRSRPSSSSWWGSSSWAWPRPPRRPPWGAWAPWAWPPATGRSPSAC